MKITVEERKKMVEHLTATRPSKTPYYPETYQEYFKRAQITEQMVKTRAGNSRVYIVRPQKLEQKFPVFINVHGGGFVFGHSERDWYLSSKIAEQSGGIVVDVDYRTTESCMFPTPLYECYDIAKWVFENCESWGADPTRISMGGHSAGATLTATTAMAANHTKEFQLALQVLDYGEYDLFTNPEKKQGMKENRINADRMRTFTTLYTEDDPELINSPYVSALKASDDMLYGMPEALVITAGKCAFRFEGEEYAGRLASCGVRVTVQRFMESDHSFIVACTGEWEEAQELIIDRIINAKAL